MTGALETCAGPGAPVQPDAKGSGPDWVELLPGGTTKARDGRVFKLQDPAAVIARSMSMGQELPVDYEHQMEREGQVGPVPAAGWITELAVRNGGIWGHVSWTRRGAELLANREYRFRSPSMMVATDGTVVRITGAGLVHRPALELKALAHEDLTMPSTESETDAPAFDPAELAERLGLDPGTLTTAAVLDRLTAKPDPAAYVPIEAVKELLADRQTARNALSQIEAEAKVLTAMSQGHLTPAMKPWAMELCQSAPEKFNGIG